LRRVEQVTRVAEVGRRLRLAYALNMRYLISPRQQSHATAAEEKEDRAFCHSNLSLYCRITGNRGSGYSTQNEFSPG
jgi:hypothetical protein